MKKYALLTILLLATLVYWLKSSRPEPPSSQEAEGAALPEAGANTAQVPRPQGPVVNEQIKEDLSGQFMIDYGKKALAPEKDLHELSGMMGSYFLLIKSGAPLPLGENQEITAALLGKNPYRTRFLSPDSPWINEQNELTDRWNTPLYFHAIGAKQVGIRSAGPDRKMWTSDDLIDGENALPLSK